jgi:hypothetical protein
MNRLQSCKSLGIYIEWIEKYGLYASISPTI